MAKNVVNSPSSPLQVISREFHDKSLDSNIIVLPKLSSPARPKSWPVPTSRFRMCVIDPMQATCLAVQAFNTTPCFAQQGTCQYFTLGLYDGLFFLMKGQAWPLDSMVTLNILIHIHIAWELISQNTFQPFIISYQRIFLSKSVNHDK